MTPARIPCVGAIVRHEGMLLVIRRGREPARGLWSLPGGRIEPGESVAEAAVREVREETHLEVEVGEVVGEIEIPAPGGGTYVVTDVAARLVAGSPSEPTPGDDADDARWVSEAGLLDLETSPGLVDILAGWGVIAGRVPPTRR